MIKDKSIFIKNVYYMLSYAFGNLHETEYKNIAKESFDNLDNLFAAILAKGIGKQLKQGLYREYEACHDNLPTVRGKIDLVETVRNQLACRKLVACDFDELSANNLYNQILKSTALQLARSKKADKKYLDQLKKELVFFGEIDMVDLSKVSWHKLRFHRYNQSYRLLLGLCELMTEGKIMTTEQGIIRLTDFADDQRMSHLYEKFILEYYVQEYGQKYRGFTAKAGMIPWQLDDGNKNLLPVMKSDVLLSYGGRKW
ncbi:5-methylcytosine restriction system specificity protein McrC [Lactobacillus delbrueckii subsp. bulgaricus]